MRQFNAIRVAIISSVCALGIGGIFGSRTNAAPVDVLAGLVWTSTTTANFGSSNGTRELTFTDGATNPTSNSNGGTYEFLGMGGGGTVIYDLGSTKIVDGLGIWAGLAASRRGPQIFSIDFSNDSTFTTGVTTDNVNLPSYIDGTHTGAYYQSVAIGEATGRYVRFNFPAGLANYDGAETQNDLNYSTISELQLFQAPEPSSLALLALGGVVIMRRRLIGGR